MKLDNSTNFVVATAEPKSLIILIIRSLESITNERTITKELLTTLLCEVDSILNSRPSTSISDGIIDVEALTPSHILLGSSQPNIKPSNYENVEVNYRKKWRIEQVYTNLLWKGWLYEYLPTFSPRTKWTNKEQNFSARNLSKVRNKSIPKSHWSLAQIVSIPWRPRNAEELVQSKLFKSYRFIGEGSCFDIN